MEERGEGISNYVVKWGYVRGRGSWESDGFFRRVRSRGMIVIIRVDLD